MMATNISATNMLNSYALFNATDIKKFIIDQLKANENNPLKDADYLGSNINAFIDIIAVMLQQLLFSYSLNASETSFSTALLYENMSRIVSLLNYKSIGKQTSILPVRFTIHRESTNTENPEEVTIPKFLNTSYNYTYTLLNEEHVIIPKNAEYIELDTILYQGKVHESEVFVANGDDFELINIVDNFIKSTDNAFISDNFFTVYVNEDGTEDGVWVEYEETSSLFLENADALKYERRFNEDLGYEFKFGNGTYGKKLKKGSKIIIYYLVSDGEIAQIGNEILEGKYLIEFSSTNFKLMPTSKTIKLKNNITVKNTGPSTPVSYPESVTSIRKNAPKVFSSQGHLFSLSDYNSFINRYFSSYIKDVYFCNNDTFSKQYIKYYYDLGLDSPQKDSRLSLAQINFMTAANFNNIYCFLVPSVNTIIDGKIPNYLNSTLKKQITNKAEPQMGITHNLVIMDPIYKAFTFASSNLDSSIFNSKQLNNKLILVKDPHSKYSYNFIKKYCIDNLKTYFNNLKLGATLNVTDIAQVIMTSPGVKNFYIKDEYGNIDNKLILFAWNPLYKNEDNSIVSQIYKCKEFEYPYFYDLNNISNLIEVIDE